MVRFCNNCKRAVDDLDKFCRSCGQGTNDSIDYHTYYRFFIKDHNDQQSLLWFMKGAGIALQQEIKEIKEKVDIMHQKLFPSSVVEEKEEPIEKKDELQKEDDIKKEDRILGKKEDKEEKSVGHILEKKEVTGIEVEKKEEHKEEKSVGHILEKKEVEKKEVPGIEVEKKEEHKEEHKEEKPGGNISGIEIEKKEEHKEEKPGENIPGIEVEKKEDNSVNSNIDNPNLISTTELLENDEKLLKESSAEKVGWPWPEDTGKDISKKQGEMDIPKEANDKLNMLLQEDEGQRQAVQYLINKYNKNRSRGICGTGNNKKSDDKSSVDTNVGIAIIPSEDVIKIGRGGRGKEKGEPYKMYEAAIRNFIPEILESIEGSSDGMIRMRLLDIAKKMGEKFKDKKPVTIYSGLKYSLFGHNIVVEMGSLKEVDPVTKENIKILKMRMKNPDDTLPPSLLERKGEME